MNVNTCLATVSAALLVIAAATGCSQNAKSVQEGIRPPVAVDTALAAPADFTESLEVVGTLAPRYEADIKSEYTGTVTEVLVTEWVPVHKGQVLARLDGREAKAQLLQVEAQAARADREYDRALKLREAGLMTSQGLEDAQTQRDAAKALLDLARAKSDKLVVRSPMDGVISYRGVSAGDRVESMGSGGAMFHVVDTRLFDLRVAVPSSRLGSVKVGQPLTFSTEAAPGKTFEGRVAYINPAADPASRTIGVQMEVPNPTGELRSGLFVKGSIRCGGRTGVLQVPREALLSWDVKNGQAQVFVVEGGAARRRAVRTGAVSGNRVEVAEGLSAGDQVVTRGAFNLQDGDRIQIQPGQGA